MNYRYACFITVIVGKVSKTMELGEFYEKYKQEYYRKLQGCLYNLGLPFHAEDIIHDVVVSLIADSKKQIWFEDLPETEQYRYFYASLKNRMIDIIKRENRYREYLLQLHCKAKEKQPEAPDLEIKVLNRMDFENRLHRVVRVLRTEEKRLFSLVLLEGVSYREFARQNRIKESTVAMRVFRLRKKLQRL